MASLILPIPEKFYHSRLTSLNQKIVNSPIMEYSECKVYECLQVIHEKSVCYAMLNRPAKRNALSELMLTELIDLLHQVEMSTEVRLLVIRGAKGYFSSGADLDWMLKGKGQTEAQNRADATLFFNFYKKLYDFPKPIIVVVEKGAFGGALGIVACADLVIATDNACFAFPETGLGLIPATIAPFVVQKTGSSFAVKTMLTAAPFGAKEAQEAGLVHYIVPSPQIDEQLSLVVGQMLQNAPNAIMVTKQLIRKCMVGNSDLVSLESYCTALIASARVSNEGQEGVSAFFENRQPNWVIQPGGADA
jgi:methylglutaconyl-CoA hydratase